MSLATLDRRLRRAILVCANFLSTGALGFSKRTARVADSQVQRLLQLMDKDKDGVVSKNEFIDFMLERFDRLDVNGDLSTTNGF